jgi:hypothetical protein
MAVVTHPEPTGASEPRFARKASQASIELYWLPLGAGGWFVKLNGRIWEAASTARAAAARDSSRQESCPLRVQRP